MFEKLLPIGLAFIMLSLGLGLQVRDFTRLVRRPLALGLGLANQMLLLPLVGAALVLLYDGRPEFALGIMILAACPGGVSSNLLTMLAGGNTALSISMTAVSSLAGILTVPLVLGIAQVQLVGQATAVALPLERIVASLVVITALPLALGMVLGNRLPGPVARLRPWAARLSTLVFIAIVVGAFAGQWDNIGAHFVELAPYLLALNLGTMALALGLGRVARLERGDGIAMAMEGGLQNAALAIFVATTVLGRPEMMVPAIIYALLMNLSAAALIAYARRRSWMRSLPRRGRDPAGAE